jgi:hypothetical protein
MEEVSKMLRKEGNGAMICYLIRPTNGGTAVLAEELRGWEDTFDFKWIIVAGVAVLTGPDADEVLERLHEDLLMLHNETLEVEAA